MAQVTIAQLPVAPTAAPADQVPAFQVDGVTRSVTVQQIVNAASGVLPEINTNTLLANVSGVTAQPVSTSLSALLDSTASATQGVILYRSGASWVTLSPGTAGQFLQTGGASANPAWAQPSLSTDSDVSLTTPTAGDRLHYDGTHWVNGREPYVLSAFAPGTLTASQVVFAHKFAEAVTFPANFGATNSGCASGLDALANATAATVLTIYKCLAGVDPTVSGNWTSIGTATVAAGGHNATFATSGSAPVSVASGDKLKIVGPSTADATLANVFLTIAGDR